MVPETLGPQARTASRAAAVEQCSRMIRKLGNLACRDLKVGRKAGSALRMVIDVESPLLVTWVLEGVEGTSPCKLRTIFCFSISAKTG